MNSKSISSAELSPEEKRAMVEKLLRERVAKNGDAKTDNKLFLSQTLNHLGTIPLQSRDQEYFPLSAAQQRLLFLDQLEPNRVTYNNTVAFRLLGPLQIEALERSLNEIVHRHEVLRTAFYFQNGQGVQKVLQEVVFSLQVVDLETFPQDKRKTEMIRLANEKAARPFDLAKDLKLRVDLFRLSSKEHVMVLSMHHISSDGWSFGVFMAELTNLYKAYVTGTPPQLSDLPIQYVDYACWHQEWLQSEAVKRQLDYWKKQLADTPFTIELSTDRPRPALQTFRGEWHHITYPPELTASLKSFARGEGVTLFMVLLATFETLLFRYTGQDDFLIGSPIAGRTRPETKALIGLFINTIVLRADLSNNPTFRELLGRVRHAASNSYENQDVPFEKLVEEIQPHRDLSQSPLFQVMFILQNQPIPDLELYNLTSTPVLEISTKTSKFDLTLSLIERVEGLTVVFEYNPDLFDSTTISRMADHFEVLLRSILEDANQRLADLHLLTQTEQQQILFGWNDYETAIEPVCIHQLFENQAAQSPDEIAVAFEGQSLTYRQLNERANQLAQYLQTLNVKPDTLVGVYMERSLDMIVGVLGILKAGGAYVPLDPAFPSERLEFMLSDSQAPILLTQQGLADQLSIPKATKIVYIDRDWEVIAREGRENLPSQDQQEHLAYVIYTSGSTGKPKGVQIEHKSVANFLTSMQREPGFTSQDVLLSVTTLSFDISVLEIFLPLITGARLELVSRETATDGVQLMTALEKCGATVMQATPVTWQMLIEAGWQGNDRLKVLCGGEALSLDLARQILERCGSLWNMYGPTETTIWSTLYQVQGGDDEISIGRPIQNTQCYILDSHLHPVPIGVSGELYIGGDGLARGYLNQPELTAEKFIPHPFSEKSGDRLYRTGDLAKHKADGRILYFGRSDNQIKIRGFRVELGEIEATLNNHPAVKQSLVKVWQTQAAEQRLVAYIVPDALQFPKSHELRGYLQKKLPSFMIPAYFMLIDAVPLTPNGKINRRALPDLNIQAGRDTRFVAPETQLQELLAGIWTDVLQLETVGIHDNFFELGGHSLLATQIISRVRRIIHVDLPIRVLFEYPTIAAMASEIEALHQQEGFAVPPLKPYNHNRLPRLSFSQERMWFMHQLAPDSVAYNLHSGVRIRGDLNVAMVEEAFNIIIERHSILRTTFDVVDGVPVQRIAPFERFNIPMIDLQSSSGDEQESEIQTILLSAVRKPFDLVHGPLLRILLIKISDQDHILFASMHHIVSDQWSYGIFTREFTILYNTLSMDQPIFLEALPVQYADYSMWQRNWLTGDVLESKLAFWKKQLEGISVLDLPTDYARPTVQTFNGSNEKMILSASIIDAIRNLCRQEQVTPFMFFLGIFKILLLRYTGQQDVAVGSPIANRSWFETEQLIGTFVNTVVLRTQLTDQPTFKEFLHYIRNLSLDAFNHQDFPFEKLIEELQPKRDMSYSPLVQVLFNMQNAPISFLQLHRNPSITPIWLESGAAQFDLSLSVSTDVLPQMVLTYNTDLFKRETIIRMLRHLEVLISSALADPRQKILDLQMLTEAEREKQLVAWNDTWLDYPQSLRVHQLVEAQVEKTPHALALVFNDQRITYRELNERANQLARHLQTLGVEAETPVGILAERSAEMVIGLLGILKAGGTYIPLDPLFPQDRLEYMLENSETRILLTQKRVRPQVKKVDGLNVVNLDRDWDVVSQYSVDNLSVSTQPDKLAYIIFTSGSIGKPKGVQIPHQAVTNFLTSMQQKLGLKATDKLLAVTTLSFDISVLEIFLPLITGACVVVVPGEAVYDGAALIQQLSTNDIKVMQATPATWQMLIDAGWQGEQNLRVLCGGETMPKDLAKWLTEHVGSVWNMYGPTETTVWSTICEITRDTEAITIGRPIANTQIYILDQNLEPTPIGVAGELYIAGDGVARGYLRQPELTAEKFLPDPFRNKPGSSMYKTGDQARYLADGQIDFLGRTDFQVKVRGFRIELGEIETILNSHPAIRQAVVIAREDSPGEKRLVAYLISETDRQPEMGDLRQFLRLRLPEYMVPSSFAFLDAFPMTPNRKVNRMALPAPDTTQLKTERNLILPKTPTEEIIASIWASVLGVEKLDINDNFFDLGGHSLLATRVISFIREQFQIDLPLRILFMTPTIAKVSEAIDTILWATEQASNSQSQSTGNKDEMEI